MKLIAMSLLGLLFACSPGGGANDAAPDSAWHADLSLRCMLPSSQGHTLVYWGFAEYGHEIRLDRMFIDDASVVYVFDGMVSDMSDGEAEGDFGIRLCYTVSDSALSMTQSSEMAMDNDFPEMVLLRLPLTAGNRWSQTVARREGGQVELECVITRVSQGPPMTVTVLYRDADGPFYQKRVFEEGTGITGFEKLFMAPEGDFPIGYTLFR